MRKADVPLRAYSRFASGEIKGPNNGSWTNYRESHGLAAALKLHWRPGYGKGNPLKLTRQ